MDLLGNALGTKYMAYLRIAVLICWKKGGEGRVVITDNEYMLPRVVQKNFCLIESYPLPTGLNSRQSDSRSTRIRS